MNSRNLKDRRNAKQDTQNSNNFGPQMLTTEPEDVYELRDAIIELYLAIKIRSTEEVSSTPADAH